ncbi:MAG TPA: hypothetical protein VFB81_12915, partial [Myxococcales bacterium]|nr:hypothetical protein [Myxococcales bacterium]
GRDAFVLKLSASGTLDYSTFMGGQQEDYGWGIAVNEAGQMFVAGTTASADFPTTASAYQPSSGGGLDAFVFKLSSTGSQLLFSTYLGGASSDYAECIVLHPTTGNPVVAGDTYSIDFPLSSGAYDPSPNPGWDAFITELTPTGGLRFSTYFGGNGDDYAMAVAQGLTGGPWIVGRTTSSDFPIAGGPYQGTALGTGDAFVSQFSAGGGTLDYSTYLSGTDDDWALGVALDGDGGTYVVGRAGAAFPFVPGSYRSTGALSDAFAVKLQEQGTMPDGGGGGDGGDGGGGGGDGGDGGQPDGGVPGRPLDALGCSCAAGISSSTAFAFAMLAAIAARTRQRRKPTSAPASQ